MEVYEWILTGSSTVFLGVAGYFLRELHMTLKILRCQVDLLRTDVSKIPDIQKDFNELKIDFKSFKKTIENRFERQWNLIKEVSEKVVRLETINELSNEKDNNR